MPFIIMRTEARLREKRINMTFHGHWNIQEQIAFNKSRIYGIISLGIRRRIPGRRAEVCKPHADKHGKISLGIRRRIPGRQAEVCKPHADKHGIISLGIRRRIPGRRAETHLSGDGLNRNMYVPADKYCQGGNNVIR